MSASSKHDRLVDDGGRPTFATMTRRAAFGTLGAGVGLFAASLLARRAEMANRAPVVPSVDGEAVSLVDGPVFVSAEQRIREAITGTVAPFGTRIAFADDLEVPGPFVHVVYTFVDEQGWVDGETITDFYDDPDSGAPAVLIQYDSYQDLMWSEAVHKYAAFVDPLTYDGAQCRVVAYDVVRDDLSGTVVEGAEFDYDSGVLLLPESTFPPMDSSERFLMPKIQIMATVSEPNNLYEALSSLVHVSGTCADGGVEVACADGYVSADGVTGVIVIPLVDAKDAALVDVSSLRISLDGSSEVIEGTMPCVAYDDATGVLYFMGDGVAIHGLDIEFSCLPANMRSAHAAPLLVNQMPVYQYGELHNPEMLLQLSQITGWPGPRDPKTEINNSGFPGITYLGKVATQEAWPAEFMYEGEAEGGGVGYIRDMWNPDDTKHISWLYVGPSQIMNQTWFSWEEILAGVMRNPQSDDSNPYGTDILEKKPFRFITLPGDAFYSSAYSVGTQEDWSGLKSYVPPHNGDNLWVPLYCSHGARANTLAMQPDHTVQAVIWMRVVHCDFDAEGNGKALLSFCTNELIGELSGGEDQWQAATGFLWVKVVGKPKTYPLEISKHVTGAVPAADAGKKFVFRVSFFGDGAPAAQEFTLADGEKKVIDKIPVGVTWSVEEDVPEGYSVTWVGQTGTIEAKTNTASATNTAIPGSLKVLKRAEGGNANDVFGFHVKITDGSKTIVDEDFTLKADQSKTFENLPNGVHYVVKETTGFEHYQPDWNGSDKGDIAFGETAQATCNNIGNGMFFVTKDLQD